jgi:hypothetical protein
MHHLTLQHTDERLALMALHVVLRHIKLITQQENGSCNTDSKAAVDMDRLRVCGPDSWYLSASSSKSACLPHVARNDNMIIVKTTRYCGSRRTTHADYSKYCPGSAVKDDGKNTRR